MIGEPFKSQDIRWTQSFGSPSKAKPFPQVVLIVFVTLARKNSILYSSHTANSIKIKGIESKNPK